MPVNNKPVQIYGAAVFIISLMAYAITCCRTVFVGDSGELTLVLTTGGIGHPPGYPLYTILGFIWLKIFFFLTPAWAANLFSTATSAAASVVLFLLLKQISGKRLPHILPAALALLYAFASPIWSAATNAEVYSLSGLLFISSLYAVIRFYQEGKRRMLIAAAFLCGLTFTHHFSAGVIVFGLALVVFFKRKELSLREIIAAIVALILPLTLYLYLLLRFDPSLQVNWMSEKSLGALWGMATGDIYRQFVGWPSIGDWFLFARETATASLTYFGPGVILLILPGIILGSRINRPLVLLAVIPAIFNLVMVATYHIPDYEGYLIPSLVCAVILMFIFFEWAWQRYGLSRITSLILACCLIILPFAANFSRCNISGFNLARHYGRDLLDSAAENSILFLKSDNGSHSALYLRYAENYRPDLTVYSTNSTLTRLRNRYGKRDFADIISDLEMSTDRIFWGTEYIINQGMNPSASEKTLRGLLYGRLGEDDDYDLHQRIVVFTKDTLSLIELKDDLKAKHIYLEYQLHQIDRKLKGGPQQNLSRDLEDLLGWGKNLDDPMTCLAVTQFFRSRGMIEESLKWVDLAVKADPYSYEQRDLYVNLGTIYRQAGDLGMAGQALSKALQIDPDYKPARYNAYLVNAEMSLQNQDWKAALEAFRTLTKMEPDNPLHYFNMAVIFERLPGQRGAAIKQYRKFLDFTGQENSPAVKRARERIIELESSTTAEDN